MEHIEALLTEAGLDPEVVHVGPGPLCTGCLSDEASFAQAA